MTEAIVIVTLIISAISTILAALAIDYNRKSIDKFTEATELELLNNTFNRITSLHEQLYEKYKNQNDDTKKEWCDLLFNAIEYFSLLVNEKFIKNEKIASYFYKSIIMWHDEILENPKYYSKEDDKDFPEFKKLYAKIKARKS